MGRDAHPRAASSGLDTGAVEDPLTLAYFTIVDVRKVRSRNVVQLVAELDVANFRDLTAFDDTAGLFIPASFEMAEGVYALPDVDRDEMRDLIRQSVDGLQPMSQVQHTPKRRSLAGLMHARGYFFNPALWERMHEAGIYTRDEHYEAVKQMGPINIYPTVRGEGDVVAHHCRTAANSGTAEKPSHFYTIPIYQSQHVHLHNHATQAEREKHLEMAAGITAEAMKKAIKSYMGRDSLSGITGPELAEFERDIGLVSGISLGYQETIHHRV